MCNPGQVGGPLRASAVSPGDPRPDLPPLLLRSLEELDRNSQPQDPREGEFYLVAPAPCQGAQTGGTGVSSPHLGPQTTLRQRRGRASALLQRSACQ